MNKDTLADLAELRRVVRQLPAQQRTEVEACRAKILELKTEFGEGAYVLALAWVGLWEQEETKMKGE